MKNVRSLVTAMFIFMTFSTQAAMAEERYIYGLIFKGFACYKESKHFIGAKNDEPFVLSYVNDESGRVTGKTFPGGKYEYFKGMDQGDVVGCEFLAWQGSAQTLMLQSDLYEFNRKKRNAVKGLFKGAAIAAVLGAALTGQDAGIVVAEMASGLRREMKGRFHDFMGAGRKTINLRQVGKMADRPQKRMKKVRYDFSTDHRGDGAHYKLFWEVRRHRLK